jgi:CDP-diacylglycerol--glycerol-3-phosphate 3-phosphatidyltransferase
MTIANALTFFRIFVSPIFFLVYIEHENFEISSAALPYVLLALLAVSELSDALDGYLARRYNQVTDFGKLMDPMADSIYRTSIFLTFTQPPVSIPLPLIFVFIYRDSVISYLRTICALKGFTLAARTSGKIKAILQALAAFSIVFLMILLSNGIISAQTLTRASTWIVFIVAIYTILAAAEYLYANRSYIVRILTEPSGEQK